jgi:LPS O-antigen subunit length determinant protein (WzzB/FepE family)
MTTMTKRSYTRRSSEQIINDLEAQISLQKEKIEAKKKASDPVLKEIPKVRRQLRKFAQIASDGGRKDIGNSVTAFLTSLDRMYKRS